MSELTFQDPKKKFCEELKAAREAKDLEIRAVAERTKIALPYLERLEAGEWEFLPHAYVRAFLRSYSEAIGLDVEKTLDHFDDITDEAPIPIPGTPPTEDRPRSAERKAAKRKKGEDEEPKAKPKFTFAGDEGEEAAPRRPAGHSGGGSSRSGIRPLWLLAVVVVVAVLLTIYFWPSLRPEKEVEEIPFEETYREQIESDQPEQEAATEPQTQQESPAVAADEEMAAADETIRLRLLLEPLDSCYVEVTADNDTLPITRRILVPGQTRRFEASQRLRVLLGNAGGVTLSFNGQALGVPGPAGQVMSLRFGPEGLVSDRLITPTETPQAAAPEQTQTEAQTPEPSPSASDTGGVE